MSDKGLLRGLGHSRLAELMPLILLLEYANKLLIVDVLLGICVDKVKLTSDKLIGVLVPRFREQRYDDPPKEEFRNMIVHVPEEAELVPALLKLRDVLWYVVIFCCSGIHKYAEIGG